MIRLAKIEDLKGIAKVHSVCFPDSYTTQLSKIDWIGKKLLAVFYNTFMSDNPELFVVADDEDKGIVGFCMGYYMDKDDQVSRFMSNKLEIGLKTTLLLLAGNKQTWRKILMIFKHKPSVSDWTIVNNKYESIGNDKRGDLLSVCVLPECRGKQYAQGMMELYLKLMKEHGRKICLLSVKQDNTRAIKYYERNGFELYRTRGTEGYTFIKLL